MPKSPRVEKRASRKSKFADRYRAIDASEVSDKVVWNRGAGRSHKACFYSLGKNYKKLVDLATGAVEYFKLKDDAEAPIHPWTPKPTETPASPAEKIDADLAERKLKVRYRLGVQCWYVHEGRWYLCTVVNRTPTPAPKMTIRSVTGKDSTREVTWPFDNDLTFSPKSTWFNHLRPLKARQP